MKKIFALALLLGLGMMVGCGDDAKPKGSAKSTTSTTTSTTTSSSGSTAAPAK